MSKVQVLVAIFDDTAPDVFVRYAPIEVLKPFMLDDTSECCDQYMSRGAMRFWLAGLDVLLQLDDDEHGDLDDGTEENVEWPEAPEWETFDGGRHADHVPPGRIDKTVIVQIHIQH